MPAKVWLTYDERLDRADRSCALIGFAAAMVEQLKLGLAGHVCGTIGFAPDTCRCRLDNAHRPLPPASIDKTNLIAHGNPV